MNADRLLAFYERIADAPYAITRLRRFILNLAVRGKLVEQDPNDEPASELLKRIATKKARLVKTRKTKSRDVLNGVNSDEFPFGIPAAWCWVRFGNIADYSAGRTPSRNEPSFWNSGDRAWVSIADMKDGETLTSTKETVTKKAARQVFGAEPEQVGTIIMSFKLTIGKIARLGIPAYHNEAIISIRPYVSDLDSHLFKVLPIFARQGNTKGAIKGATLNRKSISNILIPLPPLVEQRRIVAKVDELMALCDRLEVARAEREATRDRLATASLARLNAPDPDPSVFKGHAVFAFENFAPLTTRLDQIKALRQTILNLAVRGKLVEQDRADEPASELLKRIAAEKAKLMKAGKFKTLDSDLPRDEAIFTFSVRSNWSWCYLDDLAAIARGGSPRPIKSYLTDDPNGIPWIKIGDSVRGNIYIDATKEKIRPEGLAKSRLVFPGDLLLSNSMSFGFPYMTNIEGCIHDGWLVIRTPDALINKLYLHSLFLSDHAKSAFSEAASGAVVQNLNADKARRLSVPLPPLAEQHRIVAKVDELMALCNRLEVSLATGDETRRGLLVALLHEAMSPNKKEIRQDISTIAKRTAGRTARIARSADRANAGRGVI